MFRIVVFIMFMVLFVSSFATISYAAPADTTADAVLGQSDFTKNSINAGGASASAGSLQEPQRLVVDPTTGRLWVPDSLNNRILSWPSAGSFTNGQAADIVLGQADFTSNQANRGAAKPAKNTLSNPRGLAFDASGRLYVADTDNFRVLRFDPPITSSTEPSQVFGQNGDFTTANQATVLNPTADNLGNPIDVAVDSTGNLYVVDRFLHRISIYTSPVTTDTTADRVLGQPDLTTTGANRGGNPAANTLAMPIGGTIDANDNLYIADEGNNRVVQFRAPIGNDQSAARVFGEPDFATTNSNTGGISASTMQGPVDVAVDPVSGHLFVADAGNNRILEFNDPLGSTTAGPPADRVFGQGGDFSTGTGNKGGVSADSLLDVAGVTLDTSGNLYVGDRLNHRLLRFNALPIADLAVALSDDPDPVVVGATLTYAISVTNNGPGVAGGVTVTDTLPAALTLMSAVPDVGSCSGNPAITCALGDLAASAVAHITITATPTAAGPVDNTASASTTSNDPTGSNNSASANTIVNAASDGDGGDGGAPGDGTGDGGEGGETPPSGCGGPAGLMGCGGAGFLPLTLAGLGGLKMRRTNHNPKRRPED